MAWRVSKAGKGAAHPIGCDRDPSSGVGGLIIQGCHPARANILSFLALDKIYVQKETRRRLELGLQ